MGLSPTQAQIAKALPRHEAEVYVSCQRKKQYDTLPDAIQAAYKLHPKDNSYKVKVYPCGHCGKFHTTNISAKKQPKSKPAVKKVVPQVNTVERDKMIRSGLIMGTAPVAKQKPLTQLTPPLPEPKYIVRPEGWLTSVLKRIGAVS